MFTLNFYLIQNMFYNKILVVHVLVWYILLLNIYVLFNIVLTTPHVLGFTVGLYFVEL